MPPERFERLQKGLSQGPVVAVVTAPPYFRQGSSTLVAGLVPTVYLALHGVDEINWIITFCQIFVDRRSSSSSLTSCRPNRRLIGVR